MYKNKRGIVFILAGLLILLSGCANQEASFSKDESEKIPSFDQDVLYEEKTDGYGFTERTYVIGDQVVAESFGYENDDYAIDIDGDGINELVCNCMWGGDGHEETYVYKYEGDKTLVGFINWLKLDMPGLNYWGVNAVQTHYDSESGKILVKYYDAKEDAFRDIPVGFDQLEFTQWAEGDELPFIDMDEAFERFG